MKALSTLVASLLLGCTNAFTWGAATAAYQIEGFRAERGRQPSVWDAFDTHGLSSVVPDTKPDGSFNVLDGESGAHATQDFLRMQDTIELLQFYNFQSYRFSLSWSRIMVRE